MLRVGINDSDVLICRIVQARARAGFKEERPQAPSLPNRTQKNRQKRRRKLPGTFCSRGWVAEETPMKLDQPFEMIT